MPPLLLAVITAIPLFANSLVASGALEPVRLNKALQTTPRVNTEDLQPSEIFRLLLQHSGIEAQLPVIAGFVAEAAEDNAARCGVLARQPRPELLAPYAPSALRRALMEQLANNVAIRDAAQMLAWYNSPLGQQITTMEQATPAPATEATKQVWQGLDTADTEDQRAIQFAEIVRHTRATQYISGMGAEVEYAGAIYSGCIEKQAVSGSRLNVEQIRANGIRADKSLLEQLLRSDAERETAHMLQDLTPEQLREYHAFTELPTSQAFFYALTRAFDHSLAAATETLKKQIGK